MYMSPPVAVSLPVPLMVSLPEDPLLFFSSPARPAPLSKTFSVPALRVIDTFPELLSAIWNAGTPGVPVPPPDPPGPVSTLPGQCRRQNQQQGGQTGEKGGTVHGFYGMKALKGSEKFLLLILV